MMRVLTKVPSKVTFPALLSTVGNSQQDRVASVRLSSILSITGRFTIIQQWKLHSRNSCPMGDSQLHCWRLLLNSANHSQQEEWYGYPCHSLSKDEVVTS